MVFSFLIAALLIQRGAELALATRNLRWALARGGRIAGNGGYRWIVLLHGLFYPSLVLEYAYLSEGWNPLWPLWVLILLAAQGLRFWAIASLGRFWNTRIIVIPGTKPVRAGPYLFLRHPNYLVVMVEILVLPVLCGAYFTAALFSLANGALLWWRIRAEEGALQQLGDESWARLPRFVPGCRSAQPRG